jgi:chemotaxis protein histidine kinase CheA
MTVLTRGARPRRGGRRPGWLLLTVLLVLAIVASSALVFTNRVELLKLAVILALWAAVVAAFVSMIYRRQSDIDAAKARDLKLVYDLQLDREISARREYELTVESELRRELSTEIRAQAADEVAALRAELAALRANLEYLFDADLSHRPAIETEHGPVRPGRVASSRIDTDEGPNLRTDENPIIDVSAEPHPPEHEWGPTPLFGGAHRRASEAEPTTEERLAWAAEQRAAEHRAAEERAAAEQRAAAEARAAEQRAAAEARTAELRAAEQRAAEQRAAEQQAAAEQRAAEEQRAAAEQRAEEQRAEEQRAEEQRFAEEQRAEEQRAEEHRAAEERAIAEQRAAAQRAAEKEAARQAAASAEWQPAPAEGHWIPAGMPGSNWSSPPVNGSSAEYVGRRRAADPAMASPPPESNRGRHSAPAEAGDPGRPASSPPPTLAAPPPQPTPQAPSAPTEDKPRHRSADEAESTGGHSVAELLARLEVGSSGGGRRRRRED